MCICYICNIISTSVVIIMFTSVRLLINLSYIYIYIYDFENIIKFARQFNIICLGILLLCNRMTGI